MADDRGTPRAQILDLEGFGDWARERGGRPARDDRGEIERENGRPLFNRIKESTIETEQQILLLLDTSLSIQGIEDPAQIPNALGGFKDFLATKVRGRKRKMPLPKGAEIKRGVAPATVERYLVVCRRYYRFHMEVKAREPRPPTRRESFKGPTLNTHRRGRLISPEAFNGWLAFLQGGSADHRVLVAAWLLIAGVPIEQLTELTYGKEVKKLRDGQVELELPGANVREVKDPGLPIVLSSYEVGQPVFRSGARSNPNPNGNLTIAGFRRLWTSARRKHLEQTGRPGPTMRDLKLVGDRVKLEFDGAAWVYVPRTVTETLLFHDN